MVKPAFRWGPSLAAAVAFLAFPGLLVLATHPALATTLGAGTDPTATAPVAQSQPLRPNQAFRFTAHLVNHALVVSWVAAPGYHFYRSRTQLQVLPESVRLKPFHLPPGRWVDDPAFGHQQVYEGQTTLTIPFLRTPTTRTIEVVSHYQGCANAGICYPPLVKTVALTWPDILGDSAAHVPLRPLPQPQPVRRQPPWATLVLFFLAGIGLAFTPCVLPMVPILSATIVGQRGGRASPFALSLAYVLGMALTYTAAGVIAALTGHYLQAAFQSPWVLSVFSGLFVLLSLSMFGLFNLQVPSSIQGRLATYGRGGQAFGTFVLGAFSALIVGPCVAAPLAGALLLISRTGDVVFGGLALLALSLGMGLPLLAIGTSAGHFLPKAGPWLEKTKAIFGVLLLVVAIWLESRVLPPSVTLGLWSVLAIISAVTLGTLDPLAPSASGTRRFAKGVGVTLFAYGLALGAGALSGATSPLTPFAHWSATTMAPRHRVLAFRHLDHVQGLTSILAQSAGKPVLIDYWASWCVQCQRMETNTFENRKVERALASFVLVRADVTADDSATTALLHRFNVFGPPTLVFLNGHGATIANVAGYEGPHALLTRLHTLYPKNVRIRAR